MKIIKQNSISFITRLLLACVLLLLGFSVQAKITETTYYYDTNSNRISETVSVNSTQNKNLSYAYDSNNRLTSIADNLDSSQNISYTYDNNGNRTSKTKATDTSNYLYNAEDQLVRVEENTNTLASFAYDHQGMRIKKEGERGAEIYTYDDQSVLYQSDNNSALQAKYTYGPNQLLSMSEPAGQAQYYLFDGLGSPITLTKASGEVTARYSYDAFGNKIQNTGNSANRFTFTGHEEDRETDLIYMKARYYDADCGCFLTEDNFEGFADTPPSLNKYLYAYANPLIFIDPDGNQVYKTIDDDGNVSYTDKPVNESSTIYKPETYGEEQEEGLEAENERFKETLRLVDAAGAENVRVSANERGANLERVTESTSKPGIADRITAEDQKRKSDFFKDSGKQLAAAAATAAVLAAEYFAGGAVSKKALEKLQKASPAVKRKFNELTAKGKGKNVTKYSPINPGPLADDVAKTFRSATYTQRTLSKDTTLYRVISDNGKASGSYWTSVKPQGPLQSVIDSALDQNWGNTATRVITAKVPAGTKIYEGAAAAQRGLVGGGNQIYIPKVDPKWIQ